MKSKAAIFDLDGTLLDSMHLWAKIDADFLARRGLPLPDDYIEAVTPLSFQASAEYTIRRFALPDTPNELMAEWNAMALHEYSHNIRPKPGAESYLARLALQGLVLAVATSLPPELYRPVLQNNRLDGNFHAVVSTGEVPRGKEFPDVFLEAARRLKVPPAHCCVYEDILPAVRSARQAGMRVYAVYDEASRQDWPEIQRVADGVIRSFEDAPLPE